MNVDDMQGRTALVTGAASGIGRATALALARRGADLFVCDLDETGLESCAKEIESLARRAHARRVDVADAGQMADFAAWVVACEPALPWEQGNFLITYESARKDMVEVGIEADAAATAIVEFIRAVDHWSGTATELLGALDHLRNGAPPPNGWPESPHRPPSSSR